MCSALNTTGNKDEGILGYDAVLFGKRLLTLFLSFMPPFSR